MVRKTKNARLERFDAATDAGRYPSHPEGENYC
jgi:hypothetical protein